MKKYFLIIFSLLMGYFINAQDYKPEYLYTSFDKHFYIAGEDLWYSIFVLNPSNQQSEILYTELIAPNGVPISRQMLKMETYQAVGDIALPPNLEEGYYQFRAYTSWNLNFLPQVIFSKDIPIYQVNQDVPPEAFIASNLHSPIESKFVNISLSKDQFRPRDMVALTIGASINGKLNISVLNMAYVDNSGGDNTNITDYHTHTFNQTVNPLSNSQQIEAEKQYQRTFILRDPETEEYVNSNFIAGFIKQTQQKLLRRAENGILTLTFDDFYDSTIVQIFDAHPYRKTYIPLASIIDEQNPVDPPELRKDKPRISPSIQHYIHNYKKRFQLYQLFGTRANVRASSLQGTRSKYIPTSVYKVDDFISMENMESFIKQATPALKIKTKGKKGRETKHFALFVPGKDLSRRRVINPPLLLVNDYFTYNVEAVLGMDWTNIKQIEVFNTAANLPQQFGPIGDFGVIAFHTRDGKTPDEIKESSNNLKIAGFYLARNFDTSAYKSNEVGSSKIPNFRPMAYWNSSITISSEKPTSIEFPASDQVGTYLIRLEGMLEDGSSIYAEKIFEIAIEH